MPRGMRLSGTKLKLVARLAESPLTGGPLKRTMMLRMGLDALWKARLEEHEPPLLSFRLPKRLQRDE